MQFRVRIEDANTAEEFKRARREFRSHLKDALREAGQRVMLPALKRAAPAIVAHFLTTKATSSTAYATTIGPRKYDRITGLLNFGGRVKGKIEPDQKQALHLRGSDVIVAAVTTERRYKRTNFLEEARDRHLDELARVSLRTIMHAFDPIEHSP